MVAEKMFVGRKDELEKFKKVFEEPRGQAVLVVGQMGMGKTWLINKMVEVARNHPELKCGCVRYEVTPTDNVDSTMALMMDNAFEAAQAEEGSFDGTQRRLEQWRSLLNVINIGDLVMSLRRDPQRDTREQFLDRLELISERMPNNGRAIFIIDPEKYMQENSDQAWSIVVKQLPEKVKFVFAQRPGDVLVNSEIFGALDNVQLIPGKCLDVLDEKAVDELLDLRAGETDHIVTEVREVLIRYEGHPYALGAALDLIKAGTSLKELPKRPEPTRFAEVQWEKVCNTGDDAIQLFEAYAILEVGVPDEVVEAVSRMDATTRKRLQNHSYLRGLLRGEDYVRRIYHAILVDYILEQINKDEKKQYHGRAVEVYRKRLHANIKPDALAAIRLTEHILRSEGTEAFVAVFIQECWPSLLKLGLLDRACSSCNEALRVVGKGSLYEAMGTCILGEIHRFRGNLEECEVLYYRSLDISQGLDFDEGMANAYGNLGLTYRMRGQLDKAEKMHLKSLEFEKKIGRLPGIATDYGNLGLIYSTRGEWDRAEQMHYKSLKIAEGLDDFGEIANQYNNLGLIYEKRGDLEKAEQIQKRSLEIEKKIGRLDGIANSYGNIGLIQIRQRKLNEAKENINRALDLYERLGDPEGVSRQYSNLATLYMVTGKLDKARQLSEKALAIGTEHGLWEAIASSYMNLGTIYQTRGDFQKARECLEKALDLYEKVGVSYMLVEIQDRIDGFSQESGQTTEERRRNTNCS